MLEETVDLEGLEGKRGAVPFEDLGGTKVGLGVRDAFVIAGGNSDEVFVVERKVLNAIGLLCSDVDWARVELTDGL